MRLTTGSLLWALIPGAAWAQWTPDAEFCAGSAGTGDERLAACTRAITSGQLPEEPLATAYYNRGFELDEQGNYDGAIADYSEALRRLPQNAAIYFNRAFSWTRKGDNDRAIADLTEAIRLDTQGPYGAYPVYARGIAEFLAGRMDRAVADFKQVMQTSPELAMHAALWRYFVHVRIGVGADAVRILAGNTAGLDRTHWPTPIVDGIIDGSDVAAVVNAAKNSRGSQALPMCDIDFYMGEHALVNGRLAEARPLLRKASTGCSIGSISRHAAAAELKRVGGAK